MAHGAPNSEDDIEPFLREIMKGRQSKPDDMQDLKERYRRIGGCSPLLNITMSQASALEEALNSESLDIRVYFGMKHWYPYIKEAVSKIVRDGFRRVVALVLAPHYSRISISGYRQAVDSTPEASQNDLEIDFVESWYDHPLFHLAVAEKIGGTLKEFPTSVRKNVEVVFTAHSLPERIVQDNDPYPEQLEVSCQRVADLLEMGCWSLAYQSTRHTGEKWLGPNVLEVLQELSLRANAFGGNVLIVPIGFVADHLETLYDLDVEAQVFARARGLTLKRTESLNTSPTFISALADIVGKRLL